MGHQAVPVPFPQDKLGGGGICIHGVMDDSNECHWHAIQACSELNLRPEGRAPWHARNVLRTSREKCPGNCGVGLPEVVGD